MDCLRNIARDGRASLMFMVPGSNNVIRINGTAQVRTDASLLSSFEQRGQNPRSVILFDIAEVYSQCARALMRSKLWTAGDQSAGLPSVGDMLAEIKQGHIAEGLAAGVRDVGQVLSEHFPRSEDDENELPDRLIEV